MDGLDNELKKLLDKEIGSKLKKISSKIQKNCIVEREGDRRTTFSSPTIAKNGIVTKTWLFKRTPF